MGMFPKRSDHARFDYAWNHEEKESFLGGNPSELSIKEKDSPGSLRRSRLEKSPAKSLFITKLIMALLTAVILGACIRGVVGNSKQGQILPVFSGCPNLTKK